MRLSRFHLCLLAAAASSAAAQTPPPDTVRLDPVVVDGALDRDRELIVPSLGATSFGIDSAQIEAMPRGADASLDQVILRAPGVAADSAAGGGLHVRGEHANLQYRINDVLLPEGVSGFGAELDPRFIRDLQFVTGSLPAQYGFRTAGVVDIHTRTGASAPGGRASLSAGSRGALDSSVDAGGADGAVAGFVDAGLERSREGIENPAASRQAVHDASQEARLFALLSRTLGRSARLSLIFGASDHRFQVPDTPGLPPGVAPDGRPWLAGAFDSSRLDENQRERGAYGVASLQGSAGDLDFQLSALGRAGDVHFAPDPRGDLFFDGAAGDVERRLRSLGFQGDASLAEGGGHTWRGGFLWLRESAEADSSVAVFPVDADGDPSGPPLTLAGRDRLHGVFAGAYLQDEWRIAPGLTADYGARLDAFDASFDRESQLSPRFNLIWKAPGATVHAGYARYFTPPPVENVPSAAVSRFDGTSNAAATDRDDPVRAERADYFDAGISREFVPGVQAGLDGYLKRARNQLDDGLFGRTLILSAFNYARGEVAGVEATASYARAGFSAYANLARSDARGRDWSSSQFLFDPADLAYVAGHWIHLDHDQALSGSLGASWRWKRGADTRLVYADLIYGSGLRDDATAPDGSDIPNGGAVPAYAVLNLGAERGFGRWTLRLDVLNALDKTYELRDGSGVGVNAAQYGPRRGFYGGVTRSF